MSEQRPTLCVVAGPNSSGGNTCLLRDNSKDTLKGWLILLVVFGHFIETHGGILGKLTLLIWSFHMPLFALISGYFTKKKETILFCKQTAKLSVYFLIADVGLSLLFPQDFGGWLSPAFGTWYLLSLIFWRLFIQVLPKWCERHYYLVLLFLLVFSVVIGFAPISRELSFQRTFTFLPFFFMGYSLLINPIKMTKCFSALLMIFGFVSVFIFKQPKFSGADTLYTFHDALMKSVQLFNALIICMGLYNMSTFSNTFLSWCGRKSLWIYLSHLPIVMIYRFWL